MIKLRTILILFAAYFMIGGCVYLCFDHEHPQWHSLIPPSNSNEVKE